MSDLLNVVDDSESPPIRCANPDCKIATTGKCVEGLSIEECSFYGREPDETHADEAGKGVPDDHVRLPAGGRLSLAAADECARQATSRVLAIMGPKDSGKSSLFAGVYDKFLEGQLGEFSFARSITLPGFEELCHHARMASRRAIPFFERTPHGQVTFYELQVRNRSDGSSLSLLFGDRAGEEYRAAGDDPTLPLTFPEIRCAHSLTILVDGERLLDNGDRHNLRSQIVLMVEGFIEADALPPGLPLALVLTKLDSIMASAHRDRALRDFQSLRAQIESLYGKTFASMDEFRVAASPKNDAVPRGTGIVELLRFWSTRKRLAIPVEVTRFEHERIFDRLGVVEGRG